MSDLLPPGSTAGDYYQAGLAATQMGSQRQKAVLYFQKAIELDSSHVDAWCKLAEQQEECEAYSDALISCDRALALAPDNFYIWVCRGRALYYGLQNSDEALASFERAIALASNVPDIDPFTISDLWFNRANLVGESDPEEALISYDKAIELLEEEGSADVQALDLYYCEKGHLLFELERYEEAIAAYDQAGYLDMTAEENRLKAYAALGRENELIEGHNQQLSQSLSPDRILRKKGDTLMQSGRYEEALTTYWQAFELNPEQHDLDIQAALEQLGYTDDQIIDRLLAGYDRALETALENPKVWFKQASLLQGANRNEAALESYDRALLLDPDNDGWWYNRALILERLGRYEEALVSSDRALEVRARIAPQHPPDHFTLRVKANCLCQLRRDEEAIAVYDLALQVAPFPDDKWKLWYGRGLALLHMERHEEAIASYHQAIDLVTNSKQPNPKFISKIYIALGNSLGLLGRDEEAIAAYDQAPQLDETAQQNREEIWRRLHEQSFN